MTDILWPFKYFTQNEFVCKCGCGKNDINFDLVKKLEYIRETLDRPMVIHSGCRCETYNKLVGGKTDSAHMEGNAADVGIDGGVMRYAFLLLAMKIFKRVGVYGTFCHVDVDKELPQMVVWVG
jgi:zinc D-Ala-D-Ala carboxypeptidase